MGPLIIDDKFELKLIIGGRLVQITDLQTNNFAVIDSKELEDWIVNRYDNLLKQNEVMT